MLLGATEEKLEELGVTSAAERLKIKVQWKAVAMEKSSGIILLSPYLMH